MANTSFQEFVQREQKEAKAAKDNAIDWNQEKANWLSSLDELFGQIRSFLDEYIQAGQVLIKSKSIELNEENIGTYKATEMLVIIGRKTITLQPVGTLILGSKGRVNVIGPRGTVLLLLMNSEIKSTNEMINVSVSFNGTQTPTPPARKSPITWVWRIVTRTPKREITEFNRENFLNLLAEIAND